MVIDNY